MYIVHIDKPNRKTSYRVYECVESDGYWRQFVTFNTHTHTHTHTHTVTATLTGPPAVAASPPPPHPHLALGTGDTMTRPHPPGTPGRPLYHVSEGYCTVCGSAGRWIDHTMSIHVLLHVKMWGSLLSWPTPRYWVELLSVAQLVKHLQDVQYVTGSSPAWGGIFFCGKSLAGFSHGCFALPCLYDWCFTCNSENVAIMFVSSRPTQLKL